jgi:hypothetical protein
MRQVEMQMNKEIDARRKREQMIAPAAATTKTVVTVKQNNINNPEEKDKFLTPIQPRMNSCSKTEKTCAQTTSE